MKKYFLLKELEDVFKRGTPRSYQRGQTILAVSEKPEAVHIIDTGYIKVISYADNGDERLYHIYKPGELIPVLWLLYDNIPPVEYVAMVTTRTRSVPIVDVKKFLAKKPAQLYWLVMQLSWVGEALYVMSCPKAEQRVAQQLLLFTKWYGCPNTNPVRLEVPITQQELAASVNLARESVGKILNKLSEEGAVILSRRMIRIYPEKLDKYLP